MLNHISWSTYFEFTTISLVIYYSCILYAFYRNDILMRLSSTFQSVRSHSVNNKIIFENDNHSAQPDLVTCLTDEVKAYLKQAGKNKIEKDVLLQCLGAIAGKYPSLAQSDYREPLEQFIITEAEMNCAVFLSEGEVRGVWGT